MEHGKWDEQNACVYINSIHQFSWELHTFLCFLQKEEEDLHLINYIPSPSGDAIARICMPPVCYRLESSFSSSVVKGMAYHDSETLPSLTRSVWVWVWICGVMGKWWRGVCVSVFAVTNDSQKYDVGLRNTHGLMI